MLRRSLELGTLTLALAALGCGPVERPPEYADASQTGPDQRGPAAAGPNLWPDVAAPSTDTGGGEKDAAVLVGIEEYAFVAPVPGAVANIDDWYVYLTEIRGVPIDRVELLRDRQASKEAIMKSVDNAAGKVQDGGTLWFVFVGHGAPAQSGKDGLLAGFDVQQTADSLETRSARHTEVLEHLGAGAGQPVAIIDACFSGRGADGEPLAKGLQPLRVVDVQPPKKAIVLTGAGADEYAGALPQYDRPMFSYLALGALRGWADLDDDGAVTTGEIAEYARTAMTALSPAMGRTQTPRIAGSGSAVLSRGKEKGPKLTRIVLAANKPSGSTTQEDPEPPTVKGGPTTTPTRATPAKEARPSTRSAKQIEKMQAKQIEHLMRLIKVTEPNDPEYPDLLFRLGLQHEQWADALAAAGDPKEKDRREQAIKVLAVLTGPNYKNYARADEALYYLARNLNTVGDDVRARSAYKDLIVGYPQSRFIAHAYLDFADYYLDKGEAENALRLYEKAALYKNSEVVSFAHYGVGLSQFNLDPTTPRALEAFKKAIDTSMEGGAGSKAKAKKLRWEARLWSVTAYGYVGNPGVAVDYFTKIGVGPGDEDMVDLMLARLMEFYRADGQLESTKTLCKAVRERDPQAECI